MAEIIPRCNWLMLGQERTCRRLAKREGYCDYHAKQKVKSFPLLRKRNKIIPRHMQGRAMQL